jgi:hypothetical protein
MDIGDPKFERAFVAMSYALGVRESWGLDLGTPEARALASALGRGSRETRASALARELAAIAVALEEGSLRFSHGGGGR